MPDPAPSAKICTVCREDCSSRPRTKDLQGRYTCKSCLERGAAAKPSTPARPAPAAPPPPPPIPLEDDVPASFWNDLPAQSAAAMVPCPNCSAQLTADAVICLSCGHNRQTGKAKKIRVGTAKRERSGGGFSPSISPNVVAAVLLVAFGGSFFLAVGSEGAALAYYGASVILALVAWITTIVTAFMDKRIGWGIAAILAWVPFVGLAVLYYALCLSGRPWVRMLMAVAFIVGCLAAIALRISGFDWAGVEPVTPTR